MSEMENSSDWKLNRWTRNKNFLYAVRTVFKIYLLWKNYSRASTFWDEDHPNPSNCHDISFFCGKTGLRSGSSVCHFYQIATYLEVSSLHFFEVRSVIRHLQALLAPYESYAKHFSAVRIVAGLRIYVLIILRDTWATFKLLTARHRVFPTVRCLEKTMCSGCIGFSEATL